MESPLCPSASIDVDAQGPVLGPVAAQTRAWLSQYGTCCTQEEVEMHPVVLARVLQAVELAQRQVQHFSASNGAAAVNTTRHARRSGEEGSETVTARSPPTALHGNDASKQSACEAGVSIDFGGLWMPLSEWIATLRSVVATLPLHSLLLRDTALGDAGLRCLCREVSTASVKPAAVETASRCGGGDSHLRGLPTLPAPPSYPPIIPGWCTASTLRLLDLSGAALTDGGPLAPLLASCPYLHSLNLSDNRLGLRDAGLALLCAALRLHPSLEVLNLRRNCIRGSRGGSAIAALAELIVARFVEAPRARSRTCGCASAFCEHQTPTATAAAKPLRRLDLSYNLLGTYFLTSDTTMNRCAEAGCAGETHGYGLTSSAGHDVRAHEAVTSFPLVTAICLNNTLIELNLRNNGLPDALLEYVDAKLRVNQRTTGGDADGLYTPPTEVIASTTVRQVLIHRLRCTIDHVLAEAAKVSGVVGATHTEPKDAPPAEVPAARAHLMRAPLPAPKRFSLPLRFPLPATASTGTVRGCGTGDHQAIAGILQQATQSPPQPPWCSSAGAYDSFISSSPLPSPALIPQYLHSSARMQPLGTPRQCGTPGASVLTPLPAVSRSLSLPLDTTALSAHSAASGNTSHIGVRDVAELVRHLAESRYMTRQLQQRVHQMESSMKTAATGDASISGTSTQEETAASAQVTGKRLATSGEAGIITVAEQATPLHSPNPQMAMSEGRQRTANLRDGGLTRTAARASAKAAKRSKSVFTAFCASRSHNSLASRSSHRCSSTTSSVPATGSTAASATTSSLTSTSPSNSIAEPPVRCVSPSPSSQGASHEASSTTPPRHRRHRPPRRPYGSRRTHSVPERPRQRLHSSEPTSCRYASADVLREPEMQCRRGSAEHRRTRSRSQKRRHHRAYGSCDNTLTGKRGGGEACAATFDALASLERHCRRFSATESSRHRRSKSAVAQARHRISFSSAPLAPDQMRGSSSKKGKAFVWQRRYYDLLARYTLETTRRDADLADIHEMIECICWEQDRSRHHHRQRHHTRAVEDEAGSRGRMPPQVNAVPCGNTRGTTDATHIPIDEHDVTTPRVVAHTPNNGSVYAKTDAAGPGGNTTVGDASTSVHDSMEHIEALRSEADAWRQRCLALLQQQQQLSQPHQGIGGEAKWGSAVSVVPLPPLALSTGSTSRQVELLMSTHTPTTADEGVGSRPGGEDGECERDASTAATHPTENAVHGVAPPPALSMCPSTPAPMAGQTMQCASLIPTPAAAAGDSSSPGLQAYHPYAPPRQTTSSHASSAEASNFDSRFPTPLLPVHAQQPVQPAGLALSPPRGFSSPMASPFHISPAQPPLFMGVPGYQPVSTYMGSRAAWPTRAFPASLPSGEAPSHGFPSGHTLPATTSVSHGAPSLDTREVSAREDVKRGVAQQSHRHTGSSTSPWSIDAAFEHRRQSYMPGFSSTAVPEVLTPYPPASSLFHAAPPSSFMSEGLLGAREQLERDIRRHDQLLAAIGKLQKTASEHATRRAL